MLTTRLDTVDTIAVASARGRRRVRPPRTATWGEGRVPVRAIKASIISSLAIGLLASSAVGVAAQDEELTGPASFTGTIGESAVVGEPTDAVVDGVLQIRGLEREGPIESTDPRLTGTLSRVIDLDLQRVGDFGEVAVFTVRNRIDNDMGSWSGTSVGIGRNGPDIAADEELDFHTILLTGEGGFDGLSAIVLADFAQREVGGDIKGVIYQGELPELDDMDDGNEETTDGE